MPEVLFNYDVQFVEGLEACSPKEVAQINSEVDLILQAAVVGYGNFEGEKLALQKCSRRNLRSEGHEVIMHRRLQQGAVAGAVAGAEILGYGWCKYCCSRCGGGRELLDTMEMTSSTKYDTTGKNGEIIKEDGLQFLNGLGAVIKFMVSNKLKKDHACVSNGRPDVQVTFEIVKDKSLLGC